MIPLALGCRSWLRWDFWTNHFFGTFTIADICHAIREANTALINTNYLPSTTYSSTFWLYAGPAIKVPWSKSAK